MMRPHLVILFFLLSCSPKDEGRSELTQPENAVVTVAVSANAQYLMDSLKKVFEAETQIKVEIIKGSSGKLTAQISNGSPIDIFLSANMRYPLFLYAEGHAIDSPVVYAYGSLILWTIKNLDLDKGLNILTDKSIETIAIANDKNAPYGSAARQALNAVGMFEDIESKLVRGESISQVNQYISMESVDIGFTSQSVVLSKMRGKGYYYIVPPELYTPIEQGIVLLKHSQKNNYQNSLLFYNFLFSKTARQIILTFGYGLPANVGE